MRSLFDYAPSLSEGVPDNPSLLTNNLSLVTIN